jgi:hypothetical protein
MKGFYDDIIPSYLNNYGKQYEAKVGTYRMDDPNKDYNWSDYTPTMADMNRIGMERFGADRANMTPEQFAEVKEIHRQNVADQRAINLHSFDITPQMRQSIIEKGQPLNQIIPAGVGAEALVGQQEEAPEQPEMKRGGVVGMDAMRMAAMNIKKAKGGKVDMDAMRLAIMSKQLRKHHG